MQFKTFHHTTTCLLLIVILSKYNIQWLILITEQIVWQRPPMSFGAVVSGAICWLTALLHLPQKQRLKA